MDRRSFLARCSAGLIVLPLPAMGAADARGGVRTGPADPSLAAGGDECVRDESPIRAPDSGLRPGFPAQNPALVRRVVGASHFDLDTVRELVTTRPELAKATWDWGFGDWETALGAASHTGRREIAELLMAHGARADLFTFAMLDRVEVVRAAIEADPEVARVRGPHGISLAAHARAGRAERVLELLDGVPGAEAAVSASPDEAARERYSGTYAFGRGPDERWIVAPMRGDRLGMRLGEDGVVRPLVPIEGSAFHPAGAPSVRIEFAGDSDGDDADSRNRANDASGANGKGAAMLTVHDADLVLAAKRVN